MRERSLFREQHAIWYGCLKGKSAGARGQWDCICICLQIKQGHE